MVSKSRILANLGKAVDSATTGHFLAKGTDSNGIFETILYTDLVGTPTTLDSAATTSLIDSAYIQARQSSSGGGGGLDSAAVTTLIDSSYVAARASAAGGSGFVRYEYDTTASQTTFQDSDKTGQVLSYTEDYILVHYNGILMSNTDYTATDGSSVVFSSAVDSGGVVTISKFSAASSGGGSSGLAHTGDRGMLAGGNYNGSSTHGNIFYFDTTTPGNASTFGSLNTTRNSPHGASDGSRGVMGGGYQSNVIDYVTIATTGNAADFGDLTVTRYNLRAVGDATYGIFCGGYQSSGGGGGGTQKIMDYVTIQSAGNATDFGDLVNIGTPSGASANSTRAIMCQLTYMEYITKATQGNAATFGTKHTDQGTQQAHVSDETYHLMAGATAADNSTSYSTEIYYNNYATLGNATDWGYDTLGLGYKASGGAGLENPAGRGCFCGGFEVTGGSQVYHNSITYVTIAVPSNATDFGDLSQALGSATGYSGS